MNVLINGTTGETTPPLKYGGIERVNAFLVKGLREIGYDPKLLCRTGSTIDCEKIMFDSNPIDPHSAIVLAEAKWGSFDVLHDSSCCGSLNALKQDYATFWTLHGPGYGGELTAYLSAGSMLSYCVGGANPPYTHLGLDLSLYEPCYDKDDFILFIGQAIRKRKHLHYFTAVAAAHNLRAIAIIPPNYVDQQYFDECAAQHQFEWVRGATDDEKLEYMRKAKVIVHCSEDAVWKDASPVAVLESLAVGTPVIGNYSGGIPEMIIDGETGFLVNNEQEAIEAYAKIDTIKPLACRQYMEEYRNHVIFAKRMAAIYEGIDGIGYPGRNMAMMTLQESIDAVI